MTNSKESSPRRIIVPLMLPGLPPSVPILPEAPETGQVTPKAPPPPGSALPPLVMPPAPTMAPVKPLAVDIATVALMLGMSVKTVRREIDRGNMHAFKIGRRWRVRIAEVEDFLRRQEKKFRK